MPAGVRVLVPAVALVVAQGVRCPGARLMPAAARALPPAGALVVARSLRRSAARLVPESSCPLLECPLVSEPCNALMLECWCSGPCNLLPIGQVPVRWPLGSSLVAGWDPSRLPALAVAHGFLGSNANLLCARCPKYIYIYVYIYRSRVHAGIILANL